MGPHPKNANLFLGFIDEVNEAVLEIDSPRIAALIIAPQFFIRRGVLEWIALENRQEFPGFFLKARPL
jgi:hypothetical protein